MISLTTGLGFLSSNGPPVTGGGITVSSSMVITMTSYHFLCLSYR